MNGIWNNFKGKITAFSLLLVLMGGGSIAQLSAFEIKGTPPLFESGIYKDQLNKDIQSTFNSILSDINKEVKDIDTDPKKLIGAFGTSSIFSSQGATQRGYMGYKLFAVTLGPMVGFQLPSSPFTIVDEISDLTKKLENEHDILMGVNPQILSAQIGLNTHAIFKVMPENLYLGLKFGFMNLDNIIMEGLSFNTFSLGATANYQFLARKSFVSGLLLWRGVNFGSGIIYQGTNLGYKLKLGEMKEPMGNIPGLGTPIMVIDPGVIMNFDINTVTIPLEAVTSVRLLWFLNLTAGLGADIGFGSSNLKVGMDADFSFEGVTGHTFKSGSLSASAGGEHGPNIFNFKLMTGLGLNVGPVLLDIPVTFYPGNEGYSVGVTLGVVW